MRLIYVTHRVGQYDPQVGATNPDPGFTVLGIFSRKAVQQACLARGWRFR
jgi:hypothetical protein